MNRVLEMKKSEIAKMETIGVYANSAFSGVEIKVFEYDIDDYVLWVSYPDNLCHRTKIYTNTAKIYFKWNGRRIEFDQILRV